MLQMLVLKAATFKTAYDDVLKSLVELLREAQQEDANAGTQKHLLADEANHPVEFHTASNQASPDSILKYKSYIYMLNGTSVHVKIFRKSYDNFYAGYFGSHKTLELLQRKY